MSAFFFSLRVAAALFAQNQQPGLLPVGVWQSQGYGYVLAVDTEKVQILDRSQAGCVRGRHLTRTEFRDLYGSFQDAASPAAGSPRSWLDRAPTRDALERLPALPEQCREPLRSKDPMRNFDVFARTFAERYPFFEERGVDWEKAVQSGRRRVEQGGTGNDLYTVLVDLIRPLADGHVTLTAGKRSFAPEKLRAPGRAPDGEAWSWRTLRTSLRDYLQGERTPLAAPAKLAGNRRVLYGRMAQGIGYIAILAEGGWADGLTEDIPSGRHVAAASEVLDSILAELGDVRGIVLDLRVNSGGFDAVALEIAARFADQRRIAFRKRTIGAEAYDVWLEPSPRRRFNGPVAVLIGGDTVSAGETAAVALAALPRVRLIGQATRGELSDAIPKVLPNGWSYTMSIESIMTPGGELVEVRGVQPRQATPQPASGVEMWGRDLAAARAWLVSASSEN